MKRSLVSIVVFCAFVGCAGPNLGPATSQTYRILIPQFVMEFTMPAGWRRASYTVIKNEVTFEAEKGRDAYSLPEGATAKRLNSFFQGVHGDFRDWDMEIRWDVIKFGSPLRSEEELATYLARNFTQSRILASGEKYLEYANPKVEDVRGRKVVTMDTRTLAYRDEVQLASRAITWFHPTHAVYLLVSDEIAVRYCLEHTNKALATQEWFTRSRDIVLKIAEDIKFTPRLPNTNQRPNYLRPILDSDYQ